ncbi:pseudouridine-5'-phosphate glycosidase [Nitrospirillum amazonense]|uniref:Pseudouridine-5'-phosphate glycosidase n=1 Tax=Nitrospirillum amazonense TaxID=28077 RepID=A0A560J3G2_9PROT|nr:pseudouridine-5'-phosphate glycosidase [Nitrospirillum amazonense]MDG3441062.1 pseudouridine-5'-phosphate glycosidase [Nitrospirillum amazonense]TWB65783.1 pseudouridine-5'-phosphate glycosidase [Nitrospirillum amazonense]
MLDYCVIKGEIAAAIKAGRAVVALESTVISHGLPYPANIEAAKAMEATVRAHGAVPATIAILDGRIRIGLEAEDFERLAAGDIRKVSRRDLPLVLAAGGDGATTVAATMIAARLAGISVFATGGIGGVHRGAETTLDISADLEELARTDVAVVCAGAKAILDLPKTLEYLETRGVPVVGYGTDNFPAFYTAQCNLPVDSRCDSADDVARILRAKWQLGLSGGAIIAVPIPEEAALDAEAIEQAIRLAVAEAGGQGVRGKELTPFLLSRLEQLTEGASLVANRALLLNNAGVAAQIAVAYATLRRETTLPRRPPGKRALY